MDSQWGEAVWKSFIIFFTYLYMLIFCNFHDHFLLTSCFFVFYAFTAQLICFYPCLISRFFFYFFKLIISVQFSSVVRLWLFTTPWTAACQASLSITNCQSLPKLMSIESVMPSNHLILCRPLLLLPSIFASIRVFSNDSFLHIRWPKYWRFSFSIIPSREHPGLISFRMDWLDLLAVQGTHKSLLQHHTSKASILRCSAFFTVQLSHLYMATGKTIALKSLQSNVSAFEYTI